MDPSHTSGTSDEDMMRHISYVGIIVTFIALGIAWVAYVRGSGWRHKRQPAYAVQWSVARAAYSLGRHCALLS